MDISALAGSWALAMELRFGDQRGHIDETAYFWVGVYLVLASVVVFYILELYELRYRPLTHQVSRLVYGSGAAIASLLVASFFFRYVELSRLTLIYYLALTVVLLPPVRLTAFALARSLFRRGWATVNCLVLGSSPQVEAVREHFERHPELRYRVVPETPEVASALRSVDTAKVDAATLTSLATAIRDGDVRAIVLPEYRPEQLKDLVEFFQDNYVEVFLVPDVAALLGTAVDVGRVGNIPLLTLRPIKILGWQGKVKRLLDVAVAALALLALSPGFALIALWIRLDSRGPVFFRQKRLGLGSRTFSVIKFRTMVPDAAKRLREYLAANPDARAEFEAEFKLRDDPRVTRVGAFLRRTSLDELPQLWNVLVGEMSLVGPRPIVPEELSKYGEYGRYLLRVPPGMTGLWQVNGRNDLSYDERIRLDMYYIHNWSLWLDLSILVRTVPAVLTRRGAY